MIKKLGMLFVLLGVFPMYASAEITIDATYGIDGKVKMENPVRVDVVITNEGEPFQGNLLTTFKESYQLQAAQAYPIDLAGGEQMELSFFIKNYQENMSADNEPSPFVLYEGAIQDGHVVENVKVTENKPMLFNYDAFVVGTYNMDAAYTSWQQLRALAEREIVIEKLTSVQQDTRDYALFDVLVIGDELLTLTEQEQQALMQWVENGGKLVTDTALTGTMLEPYEALAFTSSTSSVSTLELEELAEQGTFSNALTIKNAVVQEGAVAWPQQGELLAAIMPVASGEIIQTAFALNDGELVQTNGYSHLFAKVIHLNALTWKDYSQSSHDQIANTLTTNNELFEAFKFSIWKIIVVLGVYIVIVSFILYRILKKKDKREHAWWLIPVISIVFSIGFFVVGAKDRLWEPQLQEMMLWTVTEEGSTQYFTQSVLANKAGDYTFKLNEDVETATYEVMGMPTNEQQLSYRAGNLLTVKDIPYWGVKSIVGSASVEAGGIEQQLTVEAQQLTGKLTNHFPFALEHVQAWIGREFYEIGTIAPGETLEVNVPITHSYLVPATLSDQIMYPQRNEELPVLRRNSLLNFMNHTFGQMDTPFLIAAAPEATLPSVLEQKVAKQTDVLIATPLVADMRYKGELTLTEEHLQLELTQGENYSEWLTPDTTEWYFERVPYTLKYHVPKTLTNMEIAWRELAIEQTDERLQLKVLNRETNEYEAILPSNAKAYVQDGYVQLELQFVGSEMGDVGTLPKLMLKGELE